MFQPIISEHVCYDSTDNPSHGGTYVVKGRLLLGSDWLVVGSEPCLLFTFIHRRAL